MSNVETAVCAAISAGRLRIGLSVETRWAPSDERVSREDFIAGSKPISTVVASESETANINTGQPISGCTVSVTPSVFPEAFGMVAAEAAACGSPPLVARHSGLAEVAEGLEAHYPPELRHLASFARGDATDLAAKLDAILALPRSEWAALSQAARAAAVERWSWETIAALILSPRG